MLRESYPDIPSLLAAIRARPAIFLGKPTILGLHLLLSGIRFAEDYHDLPSHKRIGGFDFVGFEQWVESRYNPRRTTHNSFSLAEDLAGSDAAGFDLWFGWLDEFTK